MRSVFAVLLALVLPCSAPGHTWNVPADAPTIQAGIDLATAGDEVVIACGTYSDCTHLIPRPNAGLACMILKSGITIRSATGRADCVVVDAMQQGRVVDAYPTDGALTDVVLEGLTLTGGSVTIMGSGDNGGALNCRNASIVLRNCRISGNYASGTGGGFNILGSSIELQSCLVSENTVPGSNHGGGFLVNDESHLVLRDCSVVSNHAGNGGGVYALFSTLDFFNTDFALNTASPGYPWNGSTDWNCTTSWYCCAISHDDGGWLGGVNEFNDGCTVEDEHKSWGRLKSLYR